MSELRGEVAALLVRLTGAHTVAADYTSRQRFSGLVPGDELRAIALATGGSVAAALDEMGRAVAQGFGAGELTYQLCDDLMNHLTGLHHDVATKQPSDSVFWQVYLAFDAGEYLHNGDERSVDPVEKYTRPLINAILQETSR